MYICSPQMMSNAHRVMWLKQLNWPFPACFSSFSTRISACSFITSKKSVRMEKWKVGVNIFRRWRHLGPVLIKRRKHHRGFKGERQHKTHAHTLTEILIATNRVKTNDRRSRDELLLYYIYSSTNLHLIIRFSFQHFSNSFVHYKVFPCSTIRPVFLLG